MAAFDAVVVGVYTRICGLSTGPRPGSEWRRARLSELTLPISPQPTRVLQAVLGWHDLRDQVRQSVHNHQQDRMRHLF